MTLRMKWKSVMGCISHNGVNTMFTSSKLLPTAVCFPKLPGLFSCLGEWKRAPERRWRAGFETRDRTVWVEVQKKQNKTGDPEWLGDCLCVSEDRAEASGRAGDGKREDVNRADLPNRYEQQGRCFYIYFSLSPAVKLSVLSLFLNTSNGGGEEWMERPGGM